MDEKDRVIARLSDELDNKNRRLAQLCIELDIHTHEIKSLKAKEQMRAAEIGILSEALLLKGLKRRKEIHINPSHDVNDAKYTDMCKKCGHLRSLSNCAFIQFNHPTARVCTLPAEYRTAQEKYRPNCGVAGCMVLKTLKKNIPHFHVCENACCRSEDLAHSCCLCR
jgi:hypothetical protein